MATVIRPARKTKARPSSIAARNVFVTRARGKRLLDREARRYFGISGEEFARRYRAGQIDDPDRAEVIRVAMLMPFAGEPRVGH